MTGPLVISKKFVPGAVGAIKYLIAMERQIESAKTFTNIRKIENEAEALKALFGEVDEVRRQAEWTILLAKQRIGAELRKVPKASGRPSKISAKAGGNKKNGRAATGISEGSRRRLDQLLQFSRSELWNLAEALWRDGRDPPRLTAPSSLSTAERRAFTELVASCPAAQFKPGDLALLISFVQATLVARGSVKRAARDPKQLTVWQTAVRLQATLATRLRLSPQARTDPRVIARHQPTQPMSAYERMRMEHDDGHA